MNINTASLDYSVLKHWGLIHKDKSKTNAWRITAKGILFVDGNIGVQKKVKLYNNKSYGFEGETISIMTALGSKFNYEELMDA